MTLTACFLALLVPASLATGAFGAVEVDRASARLAFDPAEGAILRSRAGVVYVSIRCRIAGHGRCNGRLQVLPRGSQATRLVGGAPIATAKVTLKGKVSGEVAVRLSRRAGVALRRHRLGVTVRLTAKGQPTRVKRATIVAASTADTVHGHPRPTDKPPGAGSEQAFHWTWAIPANHLLLLPEFTCPSDKPYVKRNGNATSQGTHGMQGDLRVSAGDGTGYAAFDRGKHDPYSIHDPGDSKVYLRGWFGGSFFYNSVWAPVFSAGSFDLTVICTDTAGDAAYMENRNTGDYYHLVFPWDN